MFEVIDDTLTACDLLISRLDDADPLSIEVQTRIVAGIVVLIVSEYEEFIEKTFGQRADQCGDIHASNFIKKQISRTFRSPDLSKITTTLGAFGKDYKESFVSAVENSEAHAAWDNIMRARHAVVHKQGTLNMTFKELKETYPKSRTIIEAIITAIGL